MDKMACAHGEVLFSKEFNCNHCKWCGEIFFEDDFLLQEEDRDVVDEVESNLSRLNNL